MRLILISICLILSLSASAQRIEKLEPGNWWVGMKWSNIQILIYGQGIADLDIKVESQDVEFDKLIQTTNSNYLFLYLNIKEHAKPGIIPIKFFDGNELVDSYSFELKERTKGASELEGFNSTDAIYLITPDRFANGDPSNDEFEDMPDKINRGDETGRHGGDIKGIQDKLDYIKDLGFTAIWVNPIIENNMPAFSYHGYAATDFYSIDKRFGTNEEYAKFISLAREKGLKVIMDMILNHCGSSHWFVLDPPTPDWINHQENFVQTSHKRQTVQDMYASEYDKKAFSDGWFVKTMPDLNQKNDLMADYLIQNTL